MGLVLFAASCSATRWSEQADAIVELPEAWSEAPLEGAQIAGWCSDFESPALDALYASVLRDNLSLRAAWARQAQAEAVARSVGATRWPTLEAQA
ncbi:MAG: hypothetical protein H0U74_09710, partial [Bradymonadaceae bacterium]|nr:hypothetical protein [Lujinxingiaceae bacterium]